MKNETRAYIDSLAQAVIDYYGISVPLGKIESVVSAMGGRVESTNDFDDLVDGSIKKTGNDGFLIRVARGQNERRKNFTIAHELGHLFLHMGFRTNREVWNRQTGAVYLRFGTSEAESQANEFAAALLMPAPEYEKIVLEFSTANRVDIRQVAAYFNVSISAAINRGKILGVLA